MNRNSLRSSNSNEFMYKGPSSTKNTPISRKRVPRKRVVSSYHTVFRTPKQEAEYEQYRLRRGLGKR